MTTSLMLIEPESLSIRVGIEGAEFGNPRRRVRAELKHLRTRYDLVVTDPIAERALLGRQDGEYALSDAYLCMSLSEAHTDGYCYKLVAAVLSEKPL